MPSTTPIIVDRITTPRQLQNFLHTADRNVELHAKLRKDGISYKLYISKGNGTGVNEFFFHDVHAKRANARAAIMRVMKNDKPTRGISGVNAFLADGISLNRETGKFGHHNNPLFAGVVKDKLVGARGIDSIPESNTTPAEDFQAVGLRFNGNKASTYFQDIKSSINAAPENKPALQTRELTRLASTLESAMFANLIFPGNNSPEAQAFRNFAADFITGNELTYCPFPINDTAQEILGLGTSIERKVGQGLDVLIKYGLDNPAQIEHAAAELGTMMIDLEKLKFGAELFTNQKFLDKAPVTEDKKEQLRQFGQNLKILHTEFTNPRGLYASTYRLAQLAATSPDNFKYHLNIESRKAQIRRAKKTLPERRPQVQQKLP